MSNQLAIGLGSIRKKDSTAVRVLLFKQYLKKFPAQRWFWVLIHSKQLAIFWTSIFIVTYRVYLILKRLKATKVEFKSNSIGIYEYVNEKNAIKRKVNAENVFMYDEFVRGFSVEELSYFFKLVCFGRKKIYRHGFLVGIRQLQFVMVYSLVAKYKFALRECTISTESNPGVIGVALALRSQGTHVLFVDHGILDKALGLFFHDSIFVSYLINKTNVANNLFGKNSKIYFEDQLSNVNVKIPTKISRILIACSLNSNQAKLLKLIENLKKYDPLLSLVVRMHPNAILKIEKSKLSQVERDTSQTFESSLDKIELVLAGNTSCHLQSLGMGIPSLYCDIDDSPDDRYGLVENSLVARYDSTIVSLEKQIQNFYGEKSST